MIAFILISMIICIKYKPQFKVSINQEKIGYVDSQDEINQYINEKIEAQEGRNIAFVDLKNIPTLQLELVNRNLKEDTKNLKEEIEKQVTVEYTNYAIAINGKNKTYVASKEEAQKIVNELKKEYAEKYTKKLGIIQVYSDHYEEISAVSKKEAKSVVSKVINQEKQADIKAAAAKAKAAKARMALAVVEKNTPVTKIQKVASVNGIQFSVKPVTGLITSRFGKRSSPGGIGSTNHKGLDIATSAGTPIYVAASGTVTFSGTKGELGNLVIVNHGNGVETYYAHCSKLKVSKGQKVNAGDKIALVGQTGAATGPHLHLEVHINGKIVNPQKYIY